MSFFKSISSKLKKTSDKISLAFKGRKVDEQTLEELEEALITSDVGVQATSHIMEKFSKLKFAKDSTVVEVKKSLAREIEQILLPFQEQLEQKKEPHVVLMCGVNGNGKTTTIGKLASLDIKEGKRVILAACDTFRAAAVAQLEVWASRVGANFVSAQEKETDPASVAYRAVQKAKEEGFEKVYIDTAGRLQNNDNLMSELAKISRIVRKVVPDEHHTSIMVIDGTTGQNAMSQVEKFSKAINIDGIIVTKLDGTARAGILVAVASKYQIPINYIGLGEKIEDLRSFDAKEFAKGLIGLD